MLKNRGCCSSHLGLAKLGNIDAETMFLVMFPRVVKRETNSMFCCPSGNHII